MTTSRVSDWSLQCMYSSAVSAWPREACGLLVVGKGGLHLEYVPCKNVMIEDVEGYQIDPFAQRLVADSQYVVAGVFHSHVGVGARPSGVDMALGVEGLLYVIYSMKTEEMVGWRVLDGVWGVERMYDLPVVPLRFKS